MNDENSMEHESFKEVCAKETSVRELIFQKVLILAIIAFLSMGVYNTIQQSGYAEARQYQSVVNR